MANNEPLPSLSILHYPRALNERNIQCPLPPRLHLIFVPLQRTLIILAETNLSGLSDRNLSSSYSNYYFPLHAPSSFPPSRSLDGSWTFHPRIFNHGEGSNIVNSRGESDRGHPKRSWPTRDARRRRFGQRGEKRTLHPCRRKGVSRARPTPSLPLGRASVPLLWYP